MQTFFDSINNRDKAFLFWLVLIFVWILTKKEIRQSLWGAMRSLKNYKVLLSLCGMIAYVAIILSLLHKIRLWDISLLKDTIAWFFFTGLALLVNFESNTKNFRGIIFSSVKLTIVLEFLLNLYVFSFVTELVLLPVLFFITAMSVIAGMKKETMIVNKIAEFILGVIGIYELTYVIFQIMRNFDQFATVYNLGSFILLPILTTTILPFMYFIALFSEYEMFFLRLDLWILKEGREISRYLKWRIFLACHLNLRRLRSFVSTSIAKFRDLKTKEDVDLLIKKFNNDQISGLETTAAQPQQLMVSAEDLMKKQEALNKAGHENERLNREHLGELGKFYEHLALYSAGAISLSITFVGYILSNHTSALNYELISIKSIYLLFASWISFGLSFSSSLFVKKYSAYYTSAFGMTNYTKHYLDYSRAQLACLTNSSDQIVLQHGSLAENIATEEHNYKIIDSAHSHNRAFESKYYKRMKLLKRLSEIGAFLGITLMIFFAMVIIWTVINSPVQSVK